MGQNTYNPPIDTPMQWEDVPLISPYNPDKVAELVNVAIQVNPFGYLGTIAGETAISFGIPLPATPSEIVGYISIMTAVGIDPTRNELSQQEIDRQALIDQQAQDAIDEINTIIDNINTSYLPQVSQSAWDALDTAGKIALTRQGFVFLLNTSITILIYIRKIIKHLQAE